MKLFRDLKPEEELKFRKWAWDNYKPFEPISGVWHPVVQDECRKINADAEIETKQWRSRSAEDVVSRSFRRLA